MPSEHIVTFVWTVVFHSVHDVSLNSSVAFKCLTPLSWFLESLIFVDLIKLCLFRIYPLCVSILLVKQHSFSVTAGDTKTKLVVWQARNRLNCKFGLINHPFKLLSSTCNLLESDGVDLFVVGTNHAFCRVILSNLTESLQHLEPSSRATRASKDAP